MDLNPVSLVGQRVSLEPLGLEHAADLLVASCHDEVWVYLDEPTPRTNSDITALIEAALRDQRNGSRLPFAIVETSSGKTVGSISYIDIRPQDRSVEIGWMWMAPDRWGKGLTTECMFLLLLHAFENQDIVRVAMKADTRNVRSENTMIALGAVREGVFRKHRILSTGFQRDSVYYSVIDSEWPLVRDSVSLRFGASPNAETRGNDHAE